MEQGGTLIALVLAAFSVPWRAPEILGLEMPDVAPPQAGREAGSLRAAGAPPFTKHLVFQPRIGGLPFSGSDEPMEIGGWLGLEAPRPIDALSLAFFSDALFPPRSCASQSVPSARRSTSRSISATPAGRRGSTLMSSCFARFRSGLVHEGFFEEDGVIWGADGAVLAQSRQLALLMPVPVGELGGQAAQRGEAALAVEAQRGGGEQPCTACTSSSCTSSTGECM